MIDEYMNHKEQEGRTQNESKKSSHGCCGGGSHGHSQDSGGGKNFRFNLGKIILFTSLGIIGFFLFTEHRAHLFGFLPWLFLLACPLMHLFHGHGGHGGHNHEGSKSKQNKKNQNGVES